MIAIICAFALSAAYAFLLWDTSRSLDLTPDIAGYSAAAAASTVLGVFFVFALRRSIQVAGAKWTAFMIALISSCCCFGLSVFFVSSTPWFNLVADYTARGAPAALPVLLRAVVGTAWAWTVIGLFRYADLLIASFLFASGVMTSSQRMYLLARNSTVGWPWTLIVGAATSGIFFIMIVAAIVSMQRRIQERDANERSKFREKIAAARERAALDIVSPRSELEENIAAAQEMSTEEADGTQTPTWSYWNASHVKSAAHFHPSTPHVMTHEDAVINRHHPTGGMANYSAAADEMGRRSTYSPRGTSNRNSVSASAYGGAPPPTYGSVQTSPQTYYHEQMFPPPRRH